MSEPSNAPAPASTPAAEINKVGNEADAVLKPKIDVRFYVLPLLFLIGNLIGVFFHV